MTINQYNWRQEQQSLEQCVRRQTKILHGTHSHRRKSLHGWVKLKPRVHKIWRNDHFPMSLEYQGRLSGGDGQISNKTTTLKDLVPVNIARRETHGGSRDALPSSNFSIFMQFLRKLWSNNRLASPNMRLAFRTYNTTQSLWSFWN